MNDGKILLVCKTLVNHEKLEEVRKRFIEQLAEGVAVVPSEFDLFYIPTDEMRGNNGPIR